MMVQKKVADALLSCLKSKILDIDKIKVNAVCLGLGFTGVKLSTGHVGLCHSLQSETSAKCCQIVRRAGTLAGTPALSLAEFIESWDIIERVVGAATLNALSQIILARQSQNYEISEGNLIDQIDIGQADTVALVGNIRPIVSVIRSKTRKLYIFERGGIVDEDVLPDIACEEFLPKSNVVIITGTAFANGTIDRVLELSSKARYIALIGPSATLVPDPLFERGVSAIAGVIVVDSEKAMQIVAEGGGTPQLKVATRFVVIKPK
jgi:uncharacterized protein (DUF4213/DUF364 family)